MFTKEHLKEDLKKMNINGKGTILVHSSMKSIGAVDGGAETVLDAFTEYMEEGLLIFPTHTWNVIGKDQMTFDSRTLPACVGILPNVFMKRENVYRSLHPTHSVAACGEDAIEYISGEEKIDTPCSRKGCWGKLIDLNADIMFLGCTLKSNTFIHGVEEWNNIPDRVSDWTQKLTIIDSEGKEYTVDMHRHNCSSCDDISGNYDKLEEPFKYFGAIRYGKFGDANCIIGNARLMNYICSQLLKINPDLFVDSLSIPTEYYM